MRSQPNGIINLKLLSNLKMSKSNYKVVNQITQYRKQPEEQIYANGGNHINRQWFNQRRAENIMISYFSF